MSRSIDVRTEVRRLASSKPLHAAAGVGVIASQTLRELPARIARLRGEAPVASLPSRATEYMSLARARAVDGYDKLALRGQQALSARNGSQRARSGGKSTPAAKPAASTRAKSK